MAMKHKWLRRTAGSLLLSGGLMACPSVDQKGPQVVDQGPVIGDHSEQRDRLAPKVLEGGITAELLGGSLKVHVPLESSGVAAMDHVNVTVRVVDGQTEEVRGTGTGTWSGGDALEVSVDPATPLVTNADGLGAMGRFILVVEASNHGGTTRVRRDLFRMLNYLDVELMAPRSAAAAGAFALRVNVKDQAHNAAANQPVKGWLKGGDGNPLQALEATTNGQGEVDLNFTAPDDGSAAVALSVEVGPQGSMGRWEGTVTLEQSRNVLLTTDKPRYQPGQLMNLRALVFSGANRTPYEGPVVFEVSDAKGNMLFKQGATTNSYGVASGSFRVAQRVNEGTWKARVALGADGRGSPVARQVTVEKYVLPRFKVDVNSTQAQLRPSENALVTVHAGYTFGVALNGGSAHLIASLGGQQVMDQVVALNSTGDAQFTVTAPSTPDGRAANLDVAVEVTDSAGGKSTGTRSIQVVPQSVVVSGWWANPANLNGRNTLYVLLTDSAGTPTTGSVTLSNGGYNQGGQVATVDAFGLAAFEVTGLDQNPYLQLYAQAGTMQAYSSVNAPSGAVGLTVSVDEPVVDENAPITVRVNAAQPLAGSVTVDVYGAGSLRQTLDVALDGNGQGAALLDHAPGGLLRLVARQRQSGAVGETAAFARQDRQLSVGITADAQSYKPRETARVAVNVTDSRGTGIPSAVGLTVVDEAVFALADVSGPVKAFAQGDQVDAPAGMNADVALGSAQTGAELQRARAVLAYGSNVGGLLTANLGTVTRTRARQEGTSMVNKDTTDIGKAATDAGLQPWSGEADALYDWLVAQQFLDPWGNAYVITNQHSSYYAQLMSNGPDEVAGNADDLMGYLYLGGGWGGGEGDFANGGVGGPAAECGGGQCGAPQDPSRTDTGTTSPGTPNVVRREFPETLLTRPMVITDSAGRADVDLPLADSITSWRVSAVASDRNGRMGTGTGAVRVFQDFFVDLDVPTALTEGDEVSITAVINNFLPEPQLVTVTADAGAWGTILTGQGQTVTVPGMSVSGATLRVKANRVGQFPLQVRAQGVGLSDALVRNVRVAPSGDEKPFTVSDRLRDTAHADVTIPADATAGGTEVLVKIQPGVQSEIVNGMDSMFQMPGGCFEQTSSSNYPNVLVLAYLRSTGQTQPEIEAKAQGYIQEGYQRLTSYEVAGGGFSWFGDAPAHNVLTAYGLMEFVDMAAVFPVDQALITRTAAWLATQQKADGSFEPTTGGIAEGAINAYERNVFRTTAFLAWALQRAGGQQAAVDHAVDWLRGQATTQADPYAMAVYVNLLGSISSDHADLPAAVNSLLAMGQEADGDVVFGGAPPSQLAPCGGGSTGQTDLEVTALAAHGLIAAQSGGDVANKALTHLVRNKDSFGTWQSTQATIRSLQALLASLGAGTESAQGNVRVSMDGVEVASFDITPQNANLQRVVDLSERGTPGTHSIDVVRTGTGNFQFQVAGRAFVPRAAPAAPVVTVDQTFSNTQPAVGESVLVTTVVSSMVSFEQLLVDITVPPGFDLDPALLQAAQTAGLINRADVQGNHVHVYVPRLLNTEPLRLTYNLRPRLSANVTAPPVKAYAYYDPSVKGESAPANLVVP